MKNIDGWVKRESFPVKNKSACQEATGIGCNSLSESEYMTSKERSSKSKIETGVLSFMEFFPGNGQVVDPAFAGNCAPNYGGLRPGYKSKDFQNSRYKIVAHSVK
jgi:hypothetical protein